MSEGCIYGNADEALGYTQTVWRTPARFGLCLTTQPVFCHSNTLSTETLLERTLKCILVASMLNSLFFVSLEVDTEIPVHTYKRYKFISTLE